MAWGKQGLAWSVMLLMGVSYASGAALPDALMKAMKQYQISPEGVTMAVDDLTTHRPVWRYRADDSTPPASTEKVITTALALDTMGPDARFVTTFYTDGPIKDGVVKGLFIRGGGDPALVLERWYLMLSELRNRGIREIDGPIVVDDSRFSREDLPANDEFDGQGGRPYNLMPDPLLVNYQHLSLTLTPRDNQVDVVMTPPMPGFVVPHTIALGSGPCQSWRDGLGFKLESDGRVTFNGSLPKSCGERVFNVVIPDAATYAKTLFKGMWTQLGGVWRGAWQTGSVPENAQELVSFESEPLFDVVKKTNKFSNNVMARHLFFELDPSTPKTQTGARQEVLKRLKDVGIDTSGFVIDNGSGLSRTSRVTASGMVQFLSWAYESRYAPELMASLPVTGVDGTMSKRGVALGWGRIKTGFLGDVRAIAGYVRGQNGHVYAVFANVTGWKNVPQGIAFLDQVIAWVYDQSAPMTK